MIRNPNPDCVVFEIAFDIFETQPLDGLRIHSSPVGSSNGQYSSYYKALTRSNLAFSKTYPATVCATTYSYCPKRGFPFLPPLGPIQPRLRTSQWLIITPFIHRSTYVFATHNNCQSFKSERRSCFFLNLKHLTGGVNGGSYQRYT